MNIVKSEKLFLSLGISYFIFVFGCSIPVTNTEKKQIIKSVSDSPMVQVINSNQAPLSKHSNSNSQTVTLIPGPTSTPTVIPEPIIILTPQPIPSASQKSSGLSSHSSDSTLVSNSSSSGISE